LLSQTSEYALRALLFLAEQDRKKSTGADVIAAAVGIPASYLAKVLQPLVRSGVLHSSRGRNGGFALAVPPSQLMLERIIKPFDDNSGRRHCLLGRPTCSDRTACAVHLAWKSTGERIARFFRTTSLAQVRGPVGRLTLGV
jgi:Rrf2 family protein